MIFMISFCVFTINKKENGAYMLKTMKKKPISLEKPVNAPFHHESAVCGITQE
jgi:hypothetical protein